MCQKFSLYEDLTVKRILFYTVEFMDEQTSDKRKDGRSAGKTSLSERRKQDDI